MLSVVKGHATEHLKIPGASFETYVNYSDEGLETRDWGHYEVDETCEIEETLRKLFRRGIGDNMSR